MSRRKKRFSGAEVITLSGVGASPATGAEYSDFVEEVSKQSSRAKRCGCVRPYRAALDAALGVHITSLLGEEAEADHLEKEARKQVGKLDACLKTCRRKS